MADILVGPISIRPLRSDPPLDGVGAIDASEEPSYPTGPLKPPGLVGDATECDPNLEGRSRAPFAGHCLPTTGGPE